MKIAILYTKNTWFDKYVETLLKLISDSFNVNCNVYTNHKQINEEYEVCFILSYHRIIEKSVLDLIRYPIVLHASDLPKGKGWAPFFWQILEDKNEIPITLFHATEGVDDGDFYLKSFVNLSGDELHDELREKLANKILEMCVEFLSKINNLKPHKQQGYSTFYEKRTAKDSELNINKTILEQFNLFRIVDNENFPAFFYMNNKKYIIKIYKDEN
jgi:methionyl-tRNA formyltransferase